MPKPTDRPTKIAVKARVSEQAGDVQPPALAAYVFSSGGRLLQQFDLGDGGAESSISGADDADLLRVIAGPRLAIDDQGALLTELLRIGAPEHRLRLGILQAKPVEIVIDAGVWSCWVLGICVVKGTLVRQTLRDGVSVDLPVCNAEVEIYEVDPVPIIIGRLPDDVLDRLRRVILWPPPPWPPVDDGPPGPWPGPGPDPGPFLGALRPSEMGGLARAARWNGPVATDLDGPTIDDGDEDGRPRQTFAIAAEAAVVSDSDAHASLRALVAEPTIVAAAESGVQALRTSLIEKAELARPILCWLWPLAVTTQLLRTVSTDECGRFRTVVFRGCDRDALNLYFKAYRTVGFWRIPIYAPTPISCYTRWDYACGSEVRLVTTNPFAWTCAPCPPIIAPDHWVLAMAVGNTSFAAVRGASSALAATTNAGNVGLTGWDAPFGGYLRLRFEFDNSLLADLNVHFYRVSWRKAGTANPFATLTDTVLRHYGHWVGSKFVIDPYVLGPRTVGSTTGLFEMPPALAPAGQWVTADAVGDTTSVGFAAGFAPPADAGLYEFRLDLFDTAGNQVNATTLGISYRMPAGTDLTATIQTDDAGALGLVTAGGSLVLRLHIDNNPCTAAIAPAVVGAVAADATCGLLHYGSTADAVQLAFTASHPNGFARYTFDVVRGATLVLSDSGAAGPAPGIHTLAPTVAALLGPCSIAGFAESLHVEASATDGWGRQSQYDAVPLPRAFVLSPT